MSEISGPEPGPGSVGRPPVLNASELKDVLGPDGAMAAIFADWEDRPTQREMLGAVVERFNEGGVGLVEAGTGTGKSLAYLIPALALARAKGGTTVVSTNTINLQEQLGAKDLPLVTSLVGEAPWAVLKGRGNYVSIRRAQLAAEEHASLFEDDRSRELERILDWSLSTDDGSRSDLEFTPSVEAWEEVKSDGEICLQKRCPHYRECHYQKARRRAASAAVLVVNHALLLTDVAARVEGDNWTKAAVLPAYSKLVIDEAHNLEDAATWHLGIQVSALGIKRALDRLEHRGRGVLNALDTSLGEVDWGGSFREQIENTARPALQEARSSVDGFMPLVARFILAQNAAETAGGGKGRQVQLGPMGVGEPAAAPSELGERLASVLARLDRLARELALLGSRIALRTEVGESGRPDGSGSGSTPVAAPASRLEERLLDLNSVERRLKAAGAGIALVFGWSEPAKDFVRWLELRGRPGRAQTVMNAAPLRPGDMLTGSLFSEIEAVVLTSATLTTGGNFRYMRGRLGLGREALEEIDQAPEVAELSVPSPFDYDSQTMVGLPTDLARASSTSRRFLGDTVRVVTEMASITGGGLFVLFTAYSAMNEVARLLRAAPAWRHPLFVQGEGSRARILADFVRSGSGVLLGTSSFWEGVDVPGEALRGLILHKLPFRPPSEPVTQARARVIEDAGGNAFAELTLPQAALRLKQGFGRLVRRRGDRGAVLILDDRIVRMRYGRHLLASLPPAPTVRGPWLRVRQELRRFYGSASVRGPGNRSPYASGSR